MPKYGLWVIVSGTLTDTGLTLDVTGANNNNTKVKYSAGGSGPWTDFSGTVVRTGSGNGKDPSSGDTLTLTGTIGTYTLSGTATYDPPGKRGGNGYYRSGGVTGDDADWQATSTGK